MATKEATLYRSLAARCNYLRLDRTDIQQACRCITAHMAHPTHGCCALIKRTARYLVGRPRCVQLFPFSKLPTVLEAQSDSDWAGCKATRKSTSGGMIRWGGCVLRTWSAVQQTIAMSSGEAELYAMVKAAAHLKFMISVAQDFGIEFSGQVFVDSTAAIGIAKRSGLGGRTRHVQVQWLWIQEEVSAKTLEVKKILGTHNMADILTKPVPSEVFDKHLKAMGFRFPVRPKRENKSICYGKG